MKKKSLFRKALSLICCVAMCLTTFIPVIDAATASSVTVNVPSETSLIADNFDDITETGSATAYDYSRDAGSVVFTLKDTQKTIVFYADSELKPTVEGGSLFCSVLVSDTSLPGDDGTNYWTITITVNRAGGYSLELKPGVQKYNVTFVDGGTSYYFTDKDGKAFTGGEYAKDDKIEFKVETSEADKKTIAIVEGTADTDLKPNNSGVYTYTVKGDARISAKVEAKQFTVTEPGNSDAYTYVRNGSSNKVAYDGSFSFFVNPADGYGDIKSVTYTMVGVASVQNATKVSGTQYVINNITGDVEITVAEPDAKTYNVNYTTGTGYEVTAGPTATHGTKFEFTVKTDEGYNSAVRVTVGGKVVNTNSEDVDGGKKYTIDATAVTGDINITVTATQKTYEVKFVNDAGETATTNAIDTTVSHNGVYSFTVSPVAGYNAPVVTLSEGKDNANLVSLANGQYSVTAIKGNVTITIAEAEEIEYNVTLIGGTNGDFEYGCQAGKVKHGEIYEVKVTVDGAYSNSNVVINVNGTPVPATQNGNVYTYKIKVTSDITVSVSNLVKNTYKVMLTPGTGYTLTAIGDTTVSYGDSFSFRLDLADGTDSANVSCTNEAIATDNGNGVYTISNITTDITVNVSTIGKKFNATVSNDDNDHAIVTPVTAAPIEYNGNYSFEVEVDSGYRVTSVSVNGNEIKAVNGAYTVYGVVRDLTILVETVENKLTVNYVSNLKNHEYNETVVYTYTELTNAQLPELKDCGIHNNSKWLDGTTKVEKLSDLASKIANTDATVTLTAEFEVNGSAVKGLLDLGKTDAKPTELANNTYRITFSTLITALEGDACAKDLVNVTAYGTMLANSETPNFASIDLSDRKYGEVGSYNGVNATNDSDIYLYFVNCDLKWDDFRAALNEDFELRTNEIILRVNVNDPSKGNLNAAGWIELTVGEEKFYVISGESGTTNNILGTVE